MPVSEVRNIKINKEQEEEGDSVRRLNGSVSAWECESVVTKMAQVRFIKQSYQSLVLLSVFISSQ